MHEAGRGSEDEREGTVGMERESEAEDEEEEEEETERETERVERAGHCFLSSLRERSVRWRRLRLRMHPRRSAATPTQGDQTVERGETSLTDGGVGRGEESLVSISVNTCPFVPSEEEEAGRGRGKEG